MVILEEIWKNDKGDEAVPPGRCINTRLSVLWDKN